VAATKRVLTRSLRAELAEYGPQMVALSAELFAGDEARAGMHAFLNKFAPPWAS
jgi:enoyl-CoA hydratase/methylglutaconyl-CoA hydratase